MRNLIANFFHQRANNSILISYVGGEWLSPPHFLIVGAQKAGTSALFEILAQHPQIVPPEVKEMHYFDAKPDRYGDVSSYHEMFPSQQVLLPDKLTFEASPSYLFHPEAPARMAQYSGKMHLIAILRDPVERAFSSWNMYHRFQHLSSSHPYRELADPRSFEEAVMDEMKSLDERHWQNDPIAYVKRGIYVDQLSRYYDHFPREQILVLDYDELENKPKIALKKVCSFLKINDKFDFEVIRSNVSTYENAISSKAKKLLNDFYTPYNKKLFELLGRTFNW
jgi:hypothetical protein